MSFKIFIKINYIRTLSRILMLTVSQNDIALRYISENRFFKLGKEEKKWRIIIT